MEIAGFGQNNCISHALYYSGISQDLMSYILELPYEGEAISMFILLPPFVPNAIEETISRLNATNLRQAMDNMEHINIDVAIPQSKLSKRLN